MQTNTVEQEYDSVAGEFGRRIANRWLFATMQKAGKRDFEFSDFYAMHGNEDALPEHERMRREDRYVLDTSQWNAFYERGNPWAIGREEWARELAQIGNQSVESLAYIAWLVTCTPDEATAEHNRLAASEDENDRWWAAWISELDPKDVTDIWTLLYRRHPSPNIPAQIDAQVQPYRVKGSGLFAIDGSIRNEQAAASLAASVMSKSGEDVDYSEKFEKQAPSREERALKMKGERIQAKIDRKTDKGAL